MNQKNRKQKRFSKISITKGEYSYLKCCEAMINLIGCSINTKMGKKLFNKITHTEV